MLSTFALALVTGMLTTTASAASSSEIRKQINALKEEKEALQEKISQVRDQYEENENEIADIIAQKSVLDQEIQLLSEQITNINEQISAYNTLIADKQDELDDAETRFEQLSEENKLRVRTMEEEGRVSYWEVVFKANSFSDLLDRLTMAEEITAADNRRLTELGKAADAVESAQEALTVEKQELETTKQELDQTQLQMDEKRSEADALFQQLLTKADELEAMEEEFLAQEEAFLNEIAKKEAEYNAARRAEWEAWIATSVPPATTQGGNSGNNSNGTTSGDNQGSSGSSSWLIPVSYTSITSPFGYRKAPTAGASTYHRGIDLDTGTGDPVVASRAGTVTAGYSNSAGNYVSINHQDGFSSIYMHLTSYCVSSGQIVSAGQLIGYTGSTGISKGDHLHFGISKNGVFVNPCNYVNFY